MLRLPKSCTEPMNTCTANCHHVRSMGERNVAQRRTKVSFGRTMIQALKLLQLVKMQVSG